MPATPIALVDLSIPQLEQTHDQLLNLEQLHNNMSGSCAVLRGLVLGELKHKLKHGEFIPWVKAHYKKSYRSATVYMRLARRFVTESKSAEALPICALLQDMATTLGQIEEAKLDLRHPVVAKVVSWVKGRSAHQLLLDFPSERGGDNTPRDGSGKRIANRRRTKAEIAREEFEEEAFEACRDTAKALRAMLTVEGPEEESAWVVLSASDLEKLKQDLYDAYQGVKECQARRNKAGKK
ncbi:MAG TPA: hypothetical protein VNP98_17290 [Chthoniobacterales bacterium]|nr:hypothetical protein [Chthoniobacterales bacterium]